MLDSLATRESLSPFSYKYYVFSADHAVYRRRRNYPTQLPYPNLGQLRIPDRRARVALNEDDFSLPVFDGSRSLSRTNHPLELFRNKYFPGLALRDPSKNGLLHLSISDVDSFVYPYRDNPRDSLVPNGFSLFPISDVLYMYQCGLLALNDQRSIMNMALRLGQIELRQTPLS